MIGTSIITVQVTISRLIRAVYFSGILYCFFGRFESAKISSIAGYKSISGSGKLSPRTALSIAISAQEQQVRSV